MVITLILVLLAVELSKLLSNHIELLGIALVILLIASSVGHYALMDVVEGNMWEYIWWPSRLYPDKIPDMLEYAP